jgi:hypothetical protein
MSKLQEALEPVRDWIKKVRTQVRRAVFGANNEKLDFLMDSFYKLNPQQRSGAILGALVAVFLFVSIVFILYFSRVAALESDLNEGFAALYRLQNLKREYQLESKKYDGLVESVTRKAQTLAMKPFFEKIAKQQNVTLQDIQEKKSDLPSDIILSEQLKYTTASIGFNKISVPKLMKFLVEIERSKTFLTIEDLEIRARYQDSLYFDVDAKIRGYSIGQ